MEGNPPRDTSDRTAPSASRALPRFELLARAVEAMEIGFTITDEQGRIVYTNDADARMHGYSVEELLGCESAVFSAPVPAGAAAPASVGGGWLRERLNRRRDGSLFPVRLCSEVVRDANGRRIATVTLCEDVSDELERERRLERQGRILQLIARLSERMLGAREWFPALHETLSDLLMATGLDGAVFMPAPGAASIAAEDLHSISVGELAPDWGMEHWADLFGQFGGARSEPLVASIVEGVLPGPLRCFPVQAGLAHVLIVPVVVAGETFGLIALVAGRVDHPWSAAELDSLRIAGRLIGSWQERQRAELERMRQQFISTISHELRTPLTSILGALGLLRLHGSETDPERLAEWLAMAQRNGEKLLQLVNDLLDLQTLAADSLRFEIEPTTLGDLAASVAAGVREVAELRGVRLEATATVPETVLWTDRKRLRQILDSLLAGAVRNSPAGVGVRLSAIATGERVVFRIEEDGSESASSRGSGSPLAAPPHSATTGPERFGAGLSFTIVRRLVERFGGFLVIDSAPGQGARIRIDLPRRLDPAARLESPARRRG